MKKYFQVFVLIFSLLLVACCGEEDCPGERCDFGPGNVDFFCPACDANISWQSYDRVRLHQFGNDSYGWRLSESCGWDIYGYHDGGYGDTLELVGCNESVVFVWGWNDLQGFYLFENWQGQTGEGVGMGWSLDNFLAVYPHFEFDYTSYGRKVYYSADASSYAFFCADEHGVYRLCELRVGWY